jgi:hypothetical protein
LACEAAVRQKRLRAITPTPVPAIAATASPLRSCLASRADTLIGTGFTILRNRDEYSDQPCSATTARVT